MDDLKLIKKKYGEEMMHFCRDNFSTFLEKDGLLYSSLTKYFSFNKYLYEDLKKDFQLDSFFTFLYDKMSHLNTSEDLVETDYSVNELFDMAGYILYKCESYEDTLKFKEYYTSGEELCSFNDRSRCINNYVYFAVKKDVDSIRREDFIEPSREDLYGTSVISIQINKENGYLSIKNRYNHSVNNPDATFSNNLDNIIPGLTYAFSNELDICIGKEDSGDLDLNNYVVASDSKFYKYNFERYGIYFSSDNLIIKNGSVMFYDKGRFLLVDCLLIDFQEKKVTSLIYDYNVGELTRKCGFDKITVTKNPLNKNNKFINFDDFIILEINDLNQIIGIKDYLTEDLGDYYMNYNNTMEYGEFDCLSIGDSFLLSSKNTLKDIKCSNVIKIGNEFLRGFTEIDYICFPKLETVGNKFLYKSSVSSIRLDNLLIAQDDFLRLCYKLENLNFINLQFLGRNALNNSSVVNASFPNLNRVGDGFFNADYFLQSLYIPKIKCTGRNFLNETFSLSNLSSCDIKFEEENSLVKKLSL